jgi:phage terminase large subunit-like protein
MSTPKWLPIGPADKRAMTRGCFFDSKAAGRVRDFFSKFLRHSKGQFAGRRFDLMEWQWARVIAPLFGWKRPDGTRRFRRAGIWIPKKNGKSTLCSGISLYLLLGDGEAGAEVYSAAADRDQASIVFNESAQMVEASPALSSRLEVVRSSKRIVYPQKGAVYRALSADVPTKEGLNIHGLIFDELHAQKARDLWDTLKYGGAARRQPLQIAISTAGFDRLSIGYEQYSYAKAVLGGEVDDDFFFPFIAEAGEEDDWQSPATWEKANPAWGVTIQAEEMAAEAKSAARSATEENTFRRYRLNQWTQQETRWIALDAWDASGAGTVLTPADLEGEACYGGLDLASTTDLAALVLYFPAHCALLSWFWCPEEAIRERERTQRAPYSAWVRAGLIRATPGNVIDYDQIRRDITGQPPLAGPPRPGDLPPLVETFNLRELAIDRWNSTQLATQLAGDGIDVIGFGQGFASMSAPAKEFERLILEGRLAHGGNPVLRWMVGNAAAETDPAGNVKPSKKRSREKIDGVVAAIMAIGRALVATGDGNSIYDERGVVTV